MEAAREIRHRAERMKRHYPKRRYLLVHDALNGSIRAEAEFMAEMYPPRRDTFTSRLRAAWRALVGRQ